MRSRSFIRISAALLAVSVSAAAAAYGQRVAVVAPASDGFAKLVRDDLAGSLAAPIRVLDDSLASIAFASQALDNGPFNMTTEQARQAGAVMGCDIFVLVQAGSSRRASLERADHFEAYAAIFVVSSRTGRLVRWRLESETADTEPDARARLRSRVAKAAGEVAVDMQRTIAAEAAEPLRPASVPPRTAAPDPTLREPVPYRRIKPEYTRQAYLYGVAATVDVQVDLDAGGRISSVEVVRWAGFGLDGSVLDAVRKMNWRPAERQGKPLSYRFLLRYNFKKLDQQ
ncbi:MAG: energy transducer TonB [Pyrinomonadaceae bacterium]